MTRTRHPSFLGQSSFELPSHNHAQWAAQMQRTRLQHLASMEVTERPMHTNLTSIVCTIGPATSSRENLRKLYKSGMNVIRINGSHADRQFFDTVMENAREEFDNNDEIVARAYDTRGPILRIGSTTDGSNIHLVVNEELTLTTDREFKYKCDKDRIFVDFPKFPRVIQAGDTITLDNGLCTLRAISVRGITIKCVICNTATVPSHANLRVPGVHLDIPAVSQQDVEDIIHAAKSGIDFLFVSAIRRGHCVQTVREVLNSLNSDVKIIVKIQNVEAMRNIDLLLKDADGILIARGDLGLELPPEKVFLAQKKIIAKCNLAGKPVICATQMLDSMITNPRPTRAEASDVANAVLDGTDAVMLTGETAMGSYPFEAVKLMKSIVIEAEGTVFYQTVFKDLTDVLSDNGEFSMDETVASAAVNAAREHDSPAIVCLTQSGKSARLLSKYRPGVPILAVVRSPGDGRRVLLYRGCVPVFYPIKKPKATWRHNKSGDADARIEWAIRAGNRMGIVEEGDNIIAVSGFHNTQGNTNTMRILPVELHEASTPVPVFQHPQAKTHGGRSLTNFNFSL